jgi:DNA-binding transcriptional LysR family regulator
MAAAKRKKSLRRTIRLPQIELLAAMDDAPTLSAAARAARVTQPAASRLLRALAQDLEIELFERAGRNLRPTAAGRALQRRAAGLVAELDRIQGELDAIDRGLVGATALGVGVAACYVLVPRAVGLLLDAAPGITVTVREGPMEDLIASLRTRRIDLLVGRLDNSGAERDLVSEELYDPPMTVVCGPAHPLARRRALEWAEVSRQQWILPEAGTPMRAGIEAMFRRERQRPRECLVESSSIQSNVGLLNSHDLLWVLSADIAQYFERLGALRILALPPMKGPSPFVLAYLHGRRLSPAAQRLADSLRAAARHLNADPLTARRKRAPAS